MGVFSLKFDAITVATAALLLALVVLGAAMFGSLFENPRVLVKEAPLSKNSEFRLLPGESYHYIYTANGTEANMTFAVLEGHGCTRILVVESRGEAETCLDAGGNDWTGSNATFSEPGMLLFKPWMLALHDGWRWNTTMYLDIGGTQEHIANVSYRVVRMEELRGREAYIVEVMTEGTEPEYDWVDAEKRVLLKVMGEGYEVSLSED